jgi:hypothetical protein
LLCRTIGREGADRAAARLARAITVE